MTWRMTRMHRRQYAVGADQRGALRRIVFGDQPIARHLREMRVGVEAGAILIGEPLSLYGLGIWFVVPMLPPWQKYPEIPLGSIGWRMGRGEGYWVEFKDWLMRKTIDAKKCYAAESPNQMAGQAYTGEDVTVVWSQPL